MQRRQSFAVPGATEVPPTAFHLATLNGSQPKIQQPAKSEPEKKYHNSPKGSCLCGFRHAYTKCFHLTDTGRPEDWKPKASTVKKIKNILANLEDKRAIEAKIKETDVSLQLAEVYGMTPRRINFLN